MTRVVGLDLSWTGSGMCDNVGRSLVFGTKPQGRDDDKRHRLDAIRRAVFEFVDPPEDPDLNGWHEWDAGVCGRCGQRMSYWSGDPCAGRRLWPELVVVESPAFSAKGRAVVDMGGLWWHVTQTLWDAGHKLVTCTPGTLKLWATGKGNAGKAEVVAAVARREPELPIRDDNLPDAAALRALAAAVVGEPVPGWENMPKRNAEAVQTILDTLGHGSRDT